MRRAFRDHHLLGVHDETHRRHVLVRQDVPHGVEVPVQPLDGREHLVPRDRQVGRAGHERAHRLYDAPLHGEDPLDVPVHDVGQAEQPERLRGRRAIDEDHVVGARLDVRLHIDQREDLVDPRDHREFLGLDRVGAGPVHHLHHVVLDLAPVLLEARLGVDLLRPQALGDLARLVADRDLEGVGERVCRVGAHDQRSQAGPRRAHSGRRGHGRLADPTLPREEDHPHRPSLAGCTPTEPRGPQRARIANVIAIRFSVAWAQMLATRVLRRSNTSANRSPASHRESSRIGSTCTNANSSPEARPA